VGAQELGKASTWMPSVVFDRIEKFGLLESSIPEPPLQVKLKGDLY
jgi:hypothetical protein